jgi:hypothetical protein
MSDKLSERMSGTADFWDCEDHISLSDGAKHLRDYSTEVAALEAERDALVAALHPGPMPRGQSTGAPKCHRSEAPAGNIGYWRSDSAFAGAVEWCLAANKYEAVTGRKVDAT